MYPNDIKSLRCCSFPAATFFTVSIFFSLLIFLPSCEDPSFIGLEIQPGEDRFLVRSAEDFSISSSLWSRDSLLATGHPRSLIGNVSDPLFGKAQASFMTQIGIEGLIDFGTNPVADSLILYLYYDSHYGEPENPQQISVYELSEVIDHEFPYFSNMDPGEMINDQVVLGSRTVIKQEGDTLISVSLDDADLHDRLLNAPDTVLQTVGSFISYFKGLYVTAEETGNTGALFSVNLNHINSRLSLYYRNEEHPDSTIRFNFLINERANRINLYDHDYSRAVFSDQLQDPGDADTVFYVQGIAGVMGHLDFHQLHEWRDSMPVTINSARLILPVEEADQTAADFPLPERLTIFEKSSEGNLFSIVDMALGANYFRGTLDAETGEYSFNISHWVQDVILNENKNTSLHINIRNGGTVPNRAVLRSRHHPLGGPRLEITYTRH